MTIKYLSSVSSLHTPETARMGKNEGDKDRGGRGKAPVKSR